jgi:hypothetical protein
MPVREAPPQPAPPLGKMPPVQSAQPYPAEKARGAEIILRKPWQRMVFFGGLVALVVLVLLLRSIG